MRKNGKVGERTLQSRVKLVIKVKVKSVNPNVFTVRNLAILKDFVRKKKNMQNLLRRKKKLKKMKNYFLLVIFLKNVLMMFGTLIVDVAITCQLT